jgi:hypothetical protein
VESDPIGLTGGLNTYAYALLDPVTRFDPDGLEVRYMCRPLEGASGFNHCFVYVTCPAEGWSQIYSLFPRATFSQLSRRYNATPGAPDLRDDPSAQNLTHDSVVTPRRWPDDRLTCGRCDFENAVRDRFNSFPRNEVPYNLLGPNSNSFANGLLSLPLWGVSAPIVPDAPGQELGWNGWSLTRNEHRERR